jgi:DNA-binding NarL/FixJ family response regulator
MPTAYVVDDHAAFREAASALLSNVGFEVVGTASNGREALRELRTRPVDLALVDLYLPGPDGVDVTTDIVAVGAARVVVLVSSREDADTEPRVRSAQASFIAKRDLTPSRLRRLLP